jgi:hypothetical protein
MGDGEWEQGSRGERGNVILPNSQFPIPNSQFPIPNSQFPIPNSQFPIPNSQFPIPNSQCPMPNAQFPILQSMDCGGLLPALEFLVEEVALGVKLLR